MTVRAVHPHGVKMRLAASLGAVNIIQHKDDDKHT